MPNLSLSCTSPTHNIDGKVEAQRKEGCERPEPDPKYFAPKQLSVFLRSKNLDPGWELVRRDGRKSPTFS